MDTRQLRENVRATFGIIVVVDLVLVVLLLSVAESRLVSRPSPSHGPSGREETAGTGTGTCGGGGAG